MRPEIRPDQHDVMLSLLPHFLFCIMRLSTKLKLFAGFGGDPIRARVTV